MDALKTLVADFSSVIWTSLLQGKDKEFGREVMHNEKKVLVNSAAYGFENAMNMLTSALKRHDLTPKDLVIVVEGHNSKALRKFLYAPYKDTADSRPPEAYEQFNICKQMLIDAWTAVGAATVTMDGIEADDVIAYLAQNLDGEIIILSRDKDLAILVREAQTVTTKPVIIQGHEVAPSMTFHRGAVHHDRDGELDKNPFGPFPVQFNDVYIALVGDSADKIPGAKGFGEKAFLDVYVNFGDEGLEAFRDLIVEKKLQDLHEDVPTVKALQKVIDNAEMVYASYACAKLYPEKVNTLRRPLQWQAGMVKPLTKETDERLKPYAGRTRLIHRDNFEQAKDWLTEKLAESPFVALDIETSTGEESDEWLARIKGVDIEGEVDLGVDTLGSQLTGLSLTMGNNLQFTVYFTVDHDETENIRNVTAAQVLQVIRMIPDSIHTVVHNSAFEQPVLKQTWANDESWQQNGWGGQLPNVLDTILMASYVNENESRGLKGLSKSVLNYTQETYDETVNWVRLNDKVLTDDITGEVTGKIAGGQEMWQRDVPADRTFELVRRHKMRELTAEHVLGYGADDTICTAALAVHFRRLMGLEKTWNTFMQVEVLPAYLTNEAFVKGTKVSIEKMLEQEREDDKAYDKAWATIRSFLMSQGWEGTVCPTIEELTPATIKEAYQIVTEETLTTQVRKVEKLAILIREAGEELLAKLIEENNLEGIRHYVRSRFEGEPIFDTGSPKQMKAFFYDVLKLPVRIVNKATPTEREKNKPLAEAITKHKKIWQGSTSVTLTDAEKELLKLKAKTDDTAVDFALALDAPEGTETREILKAFQIMKKVATRRSLFYKPYRNIRHWMTNLVHSSFKQCAAVTRRYACAGPNLQQLPKKGEGLKFREIFIPHKPNAVICSIDFSGQELRLMAGQSKDPNMLSCYIGSKLKDIHSITASGAMKKKWGTEFVEKAFAEYGQGLEGEEALYDLFVKLRKMAEFHKKADDLRKDAKNVNFAAQFDAMAPKLAEMLVMSVEDAQTFLDAKMAMFPKVETYKDAVRAFVKKYGYAPTMMGARRHLADAVLNDDKWIAEKAGRQGPNFRIQGSAAEMTKLAMANVWKSGVTHKLDMVFLGVIHDELVWSVAYEDAFESVRIIHECMTQPYADLGVPVVGSISMGRNFGQQVELGEQFDVKVFLTALRQQAEGTPDWNLGQVIEGLERSETETEGETA